MDWKVVKSDVLTFQEQLLAVKLSSLIAPFNKNPMLIIFYHRKYENKIFIGFNYKAPVPLSRFEVTIVYEFNKRNFGVHRRNSRWLSSFLPNHQPQLLFWTCSLNQFHWITFIVIHYCPAYTVHSFFRAPVKCVTKWNQTNRNETVISILTFEINSLK